MKRSYSRIGNSPPDELNTHWEGLWLEEALENAEENVPDKEPRDELFWSELESPCLSASATGVSNSKKFKTSARRPCPCRISVRT
jgi:hypothetical protein